MRRPAPRRSRPATTREAAAFAHISRAEAVDPLPHVMASEVITPAVSEELVEGVLAARGMSVVYGESGSGKTYLVLDLACRLALGWDWLGRRARKSLVVYVAAEAGTMILNRVLAFKRRHSIEQLPLALVTCPVDLLDPDADSARLITLIRSIASKHDGAVSLIVVDTLSRALAGGNENAPDDMGALVMNGDRIRYATVAHRYGYDPGCPGQPIAGGGEHCGKDAARGARGHSLLRAATDTEIEVSAKNGVHRAVLTKQRDAPAGAEFAFALAQLPIGVNGWGTDITACVVEPVDAPAAVPRKRTVPKQASLALRALQEALGAHGERLPGTSAIPNGVRAVTGKLWRARYNTLVPLDLDDPSPAAIKCAEETRRKQFARSRLALQDGCGDGCNDYWWLK